MWAVASGMIFDTTWRETPADSPRPPAAAGAFRVREVRYPSRPPEGVCAVAKPTIVVVLSGHLQHAEPGAELVRPGAALVLPAGMPHRGLAGSARCRCLCIELEPEWVAASPLPPEAFAAIRMVRSPRMTALALALHTAIQGQEQGVDALRRAGLASELVAAAVRECQPAPDAAAGWLPRVRDRLDTDGAEPPSVEELAAEARIPPGVLLESFAREYGESLPALIRRKRIDWAAEALVASDESIASIALSAGFFDQSHFTRAFKRAFGTTPAEQRRAAS